MTSMPDIASARLPLARRLLVWTLVVSLIVQPLAATAQVVAAGGAGTQVGAAPNGVPLVQIAAPNGAGVSRNQYQQFNVDPRGLILNNSNAIVQTQLGAWIAANPNLGGATARIILNEVVGNLPSNLNGFTEVAGTKADVVIANPNGITCNGCGFINTARGTLTTGTPVFGGDGSLNAFRVGSGNVSITGSGLNATGTDRVDILARAIQVNAGIWAGELNMVTGANQVDYLTLGTQSIAGQGMQPSVALDVAALGGMYAGKITLVGTEAGVGVNSQGTIAATGDFFLSNSGRITLAGRTSAAGMASIASQSDIDHSGSTSSGSHLSLSGQNVVNSGTLAAGVDAQGQAQAGGNLTVQAIASLSGSGTWQSSGNQQLSAASVDLSQAQINAGGDIALNAQSGQLKLSGARLAGVGAATLSAATSLDSSSANIVADRLSLNAQSIDNRSGLLGATRQLSVQADSVDNRLGQILSQGNASLVLSGAMNNSTGTLVADGSLNLAAQSVDNRQGVLGGLTGLTLSANSVDNRQGQLLSGGDATINVSGNIDNGGGSIAADLDIALNAQTLTNTSGTVNAARDLSVVSQTTDNGGGLLRAGRDLTHRQTTAGSAGAVGQQEAGRDATLYSAGDLTLLAGERAYAGNQLNVQAVNGIASAGGLSALNQLTLTANNLTLQAGSQTTASIATLTATQTLSNQGILSADTLTLNAAQLNNSAGIVANDITINAGTLNNSGSAALIGALNNLTVNADTVSNQNNATLYANNDIVVQGSGAGATGSSLTNSGAVIEAGRDLGINMAQVSNLRTGLSLTSSVINSLNLYYQAAGDIWPSAPYSGNDIYLMTSPLTSYERERWVDVTVTRDSIAQAGTAAQMQSGRHLTLVAQNLTNTASIIAAAGNLTANVSGTLNNSGVTLYETALIATHHMNCVDYPGGSCRSGRSDVYTNDSSNTVIGGVASTLQGATSVVLNTGTLNLTNSSPRNIVAPGASGALPSTLAATTPGALPPIVVPQGGLFAVNANPGSRYLIETDPRFSKVGLISSSYFLQQLGLDPDALGKRLGDATVEARVVRDQLFNATGRRFLAGTTSDNDQLTALYDAGVRSASVLQLQAGIALTAAQVAALTSDILWLEKESVTLADGSRADVLVPRLYLAHLQERDLNPNGSLIAGGQVDLYAAGDLKLQGVIHAASSLNLNLTAQAGRDINLLASSDRTQVQYAGGSSNPKKGAYASGFSDDESTTGSRLTANGNLTLTAGASQGETAGQGNLYAQGATLRAGQDINLQATQIVLDAAQENHAAQSSYRRVGKGGVRQYQSSSTSSQSLGSIVDAGGNLNLTSSGDTVVVGAALAAGNLAKLDIGGNLSLLVSQSSSARQISDYNQGHKKATTLAYSDSEIRQILTTITVGQGLTLDVGGNFQADIGARDAEGQLQADRMTTDGIVRGDSRQQVSITRTGAASNGTDQSEVRGQLSSQGIRSGAKDAFDPIAAQTGQNAVAQYLQSGLVQIKSDPQLQSRLQNILANTQGTQFTYKDDSGKLSLTVAGQAKVQEVYNTLKLTETFDVKKFANAQTAQVVTLVAAIVLTVMTGGAGAGTLGAALTTVGSTGALMINAAVIAMGSTMIGQLAGGGSFEQAFSAGLKAGAISAITAGVGAELGGSLSDANKITEVGQDGVRRLTETGANYQSMSALDKMGASYYWQQASLNATVQGAANTLQGGSFKDGFVGSLGKTVGSSFNTAVGDWAKVEGVADGSIEKALLHGGIGALQSAVTKQSVAGGAIGGVTAELLSPVNSQLDAQTGSKLASQLLTAGVSMLAAQAVKPGDTSATLAAANQALQTDQFNRQLHAPEQSLAAKLAKESNGKWTKQQVADALRAANNNDLGETITTGMVVPLNKDTKASDIYDTAGLQLVRDESTGKSFLVQSVVSKVDPELASYIQSKTGSTYSWDTGLLPKTPSPDNVAWTSNGNVPIATPGTTPVETRYAFVVANGKYFSVPVADCPAGACTNGASVAWASTNPRDQQVLAAYADALDKEATKGATKIGIAGGAIALAPVTFGGSLVVGGVVSGASNVSDQYIDTGSVDPIKAGKATAVGVVLGGVTFGVVKGAGMADAALEGMLPSAGKAATPSAVVNVAPEIKIVGTDMAAANDAAYNLPAANSGTKLASIEVDLAKASKGTPEYSILNDPPPSSQVKLSNGTEFKTNPNGYVDEITYSPSLSQGVRDARQTAVGKEGLPTDVGGHVQGCQFGGTCDRFNLFPQDSNFNNSAYKRFENEVKGALNNGDQVGPVTVRFSRTDPTSVRPDSLTIDYSINGVPKQRFFENKAGQ